MNFNRNLVNKNKLFQHSNLPTEENTLELIKNKNNLPVNEKVIDKEDYSNKDYLIKYLYKENPAFFEKFDLYDYLNSGSIGYVYKGAYKGPVKKQVAIKFIINKKRKEKENSNLEEINISKKLHNKNVTEIFAFYKNDKICYNIYCNNNQEEERNGKRRDSQKRNQRTGGKGGLQSGKCYQNKTAVRGAYAKVADKISGVQGP